MTNLNAHTFLVRRPPPGLPLAFLLSLLTALVYWPGLDGGFIFDDLASIVDNGRLHAESINAKSLARAAHSFDPGGLGRPLAMISFAVDHAIGGLDPWGYKFSNLLVHLINALLVFALVRSLFGFARIPDDKRDLAAAAIALLWAIHPLQVSTVLYVVQRMEMLSLTFILMALLAYLHARDRQIKGKNGWPWLMTCVPLLVLGLASKETAALLPIYTLSLELTVLGFLAKKPLVSRSWRWLYAAGAVIGVLIFVFMVYPKYATSEAYFIRDFTFDQRLLSQLRILPMYLGQIVLPLPHLMTFYYDDFPASQGLFAPHTTALGGLLLVTLLVVALMLRRRAPMFSLGILWFFAAHAMTSNIVPLELVFEHRNYFALLGILLSVGDLVSRIQLKDGLALRYVSIAVVTVGFALLAAIRVATWGDPFLLATDLVDKNPRSSRASTDLGAIYLEMTDGHKYSPFYDFALREFERGSQLPTASVISDQALILTAASAGRPIKDMWWIRLIGKLRTDTIRPDTSSAMFGLLQNRSRGVELDDTRLTEAFMVLFSRATLSAVSYAQFGNYALTYRRDETLADRMFVKAIEQSVSRPDYAERVVSLLIEQRHLRQARVALVRAIELGLVEETRFDLTTLQIDQERVKFHLHDAGKK